MSKEAGNYGCAFQHVPAFAEYTLQEAGENYDAVRNMRSWHSVSITALMEFVMLHWRRLEESGVFW